MASRPATGTPTCPRPSRSTPRTPSRPSTRGRRSSTRTHPTWWSAPPRRPSSTRPRSARSWSSIRACSATPPPGSAGPSKTATATSRSSGAGDRWGVWPPIIEALVLFLAIPGDTPFEGGDAVLGGSLLDTPIARAALERGGHLRVGIEDWDDGPANVEQVAAAVALCTEVGRPIATIQQTEQLLGLPS